MASCLIFNSVNGNHHFFFVAGADTSSQFAFSFSDHDGIDGDKIYAVGFGNSGHLQKVKDASSVLNACKQLFLDDVEIDGYAIHDWRNNPFALSACCYFGPAFASKYLSALQESHGKYIFMASANWTDG